MANPPADDSQQNQEYQIISNLQKQEYYIQIQNQLFRNNDQNSINQNKLLNFKDKKIGY